MTFPKTSLSCNNDFFPRVVIVILNWNNAPDTIGCIESVSKLNYPNFSILIVDNGSNDGSVACIRSKNPGIDILELETNIGYASGNNAGIKHAIEAEADYIFILNNDTLVSPDLLAELVAVLESRPKIGMVGPTMYCTDPQGTLFAAGSKVLWNQGNIEHRGLFQPAKQFNKYMMKNEPVDFIAGCGVLVSRRLIEVAGVLDPAYYLNYEDVEWGVRAWRYGFEVWYAPQAIMWHKVSAVLGRGSPANTYYMTRNALLFFSRNGPTCFRWLPVSRIIIRTLRTIGAWTIKVQYRDEIFQRKRDANLLALRDFFLGRYGEMGQDVARVCYGD